MKTKQEQWMRNVKGTYDYLPAEQIQRNQVIGVLQEVFETYGFDPIETPILTMEEVLASKYAGGAEIMKEVYTLSDQGERKLGLRYDLTVPFAKFIGLNKDNLTFPFKKYEIGKAYRNGPIKRGRKRAFIQADVDVVGSSSIFEEVGFFRMITQVAKALEMNVVVKYNDRRVLAALLKSFSIKEAEINTIILTIDKLEKLTLEEVLKELQDKGLDIDRGKRLLDIISNCNSDEIQKIINQEEMSDFKELIALISQLNDSNRVTFKFTPSLARGLEVYTGTIWEVFVADTDSEITSSIGAGGRYDGIVGQLLGIDQVYPAVGMTFGVDVIMEVLRDRGPWAKQTTVLYLIIPMEGQENIASNYAEQLRESGVRVDIDYSKKRIKKSLNRANKLDIPYVTVFGEDEAKTGNIKIKDMKIGNETCFSLYDIEAITTFICGQ